LGSSLRTGKGLRYPKEPHTKKEGKIEVRALDKGFLPGKRKQGPESAEWGKLSHVRRGGPEISVRIPRNSNKGREKRRRGFSPGESTNFGTRGELKKVRISRGEGSNEKNFKREKEGNRKKTRSEVGVCGGKTESKGGKRVDFRSKYRRKTTKKRNLAG